MSSERNAISRPRVSVIVPAYNAGSTITRCLESLARQDYPHSQFEILVVDDGSTDETPSLVEEFVLQEKNHSIRLLRQSNAGPAVARNYGVREALGEIVVFTDSDCFPCIDWLSRMISPFDNSEISGVKGAYLTQQSSWTARFVQVEYESKYRRMKRFPYIDFIDTYSAAFRRDVFLNAGGFDVSFAKASVEDQEFSFRLASAGHKMVFVPEARVNHLHVDRLWGYMRKKFKIGFYKALLLMKHPGKISGDTHTPKSLQIQILSFYVLPVAMCYSGLGLVGWWLPLFVAGAYILSLIPLTLFAFAQYPVFAFLAPIVITCRAAALGAGLMLGSIRFLPSRFPRTDGRPVSKE